MNREQKSAHQRAFARYLRTGQRLTAAEWQVRERKFNPYHDPENGRFTFAPGGNGSSGSSASLTNGGKPYPVRIDLRNGAKPYPSRAKLPPATRQRAPHAALKPAAPRVIRFGHSDDLDLTPPVVEKANVLSDAVQLWTGYPIFVTSGRRGPDRQAAAMYGNYADKTSTPYANVAAERAVKRAFDEGRKAGKTRNQVIGDMANVLKAQVNRNIFISRHMRSEAIDIRTPPSTVLQAIRSHPSVQSVLVENDHIHVQFR